MKKYSSKWLKMAILGLINYFKWEKKGENLGTSPGLGSPQRALFHFFMSDRQAWSQSRTGIEPAEYQPWFNNIVS